MSYSVTMLNSCKKKIAESEGIRRGIETFLLAHRPSAWIANDGTTDYDGGQFRTEVYITRVFDHHYVVDTSAYCNMEE